MKKKILKKYIDYDKNEKLFYNNFYLNELNLSIKIPIIDIESQNLKKEFIVKEFDLINYTYLLNYD